jgi:hypothetical protein
MSNKVTILNIFLIMGVIISLYVYVNRDTTDDNSKFLLILPISSIILSIYVMGYINPRVEELSSQIDGFLNGSVDVNQT